MIPRTVPTWQSQTWQEQLIDCVRDGKELCRLLQLDPDRFDTACHDASEAFPLRVPRSYVGRMRAGDINDPLLLQVLPQTQEMIATVGYVEDPLEEAEHTPAPGAIQKYHGRVLLVVSGSCAVHCRYCFRRHFPYQQHQRSKSEWQQVLDAIAGDDTINEIILSGGDPLSASDKQLAWLAAQIEAVPHITTLRIHTRLPVVIPQRIDSHCLHWLTAGRLQKVMVLHCNHPNEIDRDFATAMASLRDSNVHLLNQSVLLRGVNDDADVLAQLSRKLFHCGVMPYYLHLLDKVEGTHHFDIAEGRATEIHRQLAGRLPGYLVPKLAREIPGAHAKTIIA